MSIAIAATIAVVMVTLVCVLVLPSARGDKSSSDSVQDIHFPTTTHPLPPRTTWGTLKPPYPTGAYWLNIALGLVPPYQVAGATLTEVYL
jgi:hypothetical protein